MSRTSTICVLSGALAVLAPPANGASSVHTPKVTVHTPAPPKHNNATIAEYRNGTQYSMPMKPPGRTGFKPITLNRGVRCRPECGWNCARRNFRQHHCSRSSDEIKLLIDKRSSKSLPTINLAHVDLA
jgi:hypothetical protein